MGNNNKHNITTSMVVFFILTALFMTVGIIICIYKIQVVDGPKWREIAEDRETSTQPMPARRGDIKSSDGKVLATTTPICDLYLDIRTLKLDANAKIQHKFDSTLPRVCNILHNIDKSKSAKYYYDLIRNEYNKKKPSGCKLIKKNIPYVDWVAINNEVGWGRFVLKSVAVKNDEGETVDVSVIRNIRAHIYNNLGENTIGFQNNLLSKTYTGLEGYYDSILRGQDGLYIFRRLTRGVWIPTEHYHFQRFMDSNAIVVKPTIDGQDIVSTIDTRFQDVAENSLRESLRTYGAQSGCVILMEKETGYVLACSNLALDTNTNTYKELRDRNIACSEIYEPGSTFKAVIMTAMLEDTINLDTSKCVLLGRKQYPGRLITDGSHAVVDSGNIAEVMAKSSNVGMCELGWEYYRNDRARLKKLVQSIFPYDLLQYDINTLQTKGHINNLSSNSDFLNFCYGYATNVTAMQLVTFYNGLANNGVMVKPQFCKKIGNNDIKPIVLNERMCSEQTAQIMTDLLVGVIENEHGTGNNIRNPQYTIAGKTGTAINNYQKGQSHIYNASFAGYFPADNPKYTCLVVVKKVRQHGRQAASPVFKKVADCVMAIDSTIKYEQKTIENGDPTALPYVNRGNQSEIMQISQILNIPFHSSDSTAEWCSYSASETGAIGSYNKMATQNGRMPNCIGMTAKDAVLLLNQHGIKAVITGYGKVKRQTPKPGAETNNKTTARLTLAN